MHFLLLEEFPVSVSDANRVEDFLSPVSSFSSLLSVLTEVPKKSFLLKRIIKQVRKSKDIFPQKNIFIYSKENHNFKISETNALNLTDSESSNFSSNPPQTEEKILFKLISKITKDLEKNKKKQPEKELKKDSKNSQKMTWEMHLWWNLHGPKWLTDRNYLHSLFSFYKLNPLEFSKTSEFEKVKTGKTDKTR